MYIKPPAHRRAAIASRHRHLRTPLTAILVGLAVPALLGGTVLAGPASASSEFTTHLTPNNTFFLLLDVSGASTAPGAGVIDWTATGGANQEWTFEPTGATNTYEIVNANSHQCLSADNVQGDQVYQWPCLGVASQEWVTALVPGTVYSYTISNVWSQLYLDVKGDSSAAGTQIDTWPYTGQSNQYFAGV